jgi:hypothetical protein
MKYILVFQSALLLVFVVVLLMLSVQLDHATALAKDAVSTTVQCIAQFHKALGK